MTLCAASRMMDAFCTIAVTLGMSTDDVAWKNHRELCFEFGNSTHTRCSATSGEQLSAIAASMTSSMHVFVYRPIADAGRPLNDAVILSYIIPFAWLDEVVELLDVENSHDSCPIVHRWVVHEHGVVAPNSVCTDGVGHVGRKGPTSATLGGRVYAVSTPAFLEEDTVSRAIRGVSRRLNQ